MKRHINIPVFIPHQGCPNDCVFCNQRKISGKLCFDMENVKNEIDTALSTIDRENASVQIAFFGGSFTGIARNDMIYLLSLAKEYIDMGRVHSIRLSTRPDYIDEKILGILKKYNVKTIELGIQSMVDKVLLSSKRGHTSKDTYDACKLIKEYGFELVGQMMTGLPASTPPDEIYTAEVLCSLGIDGARIYPVMVFYGTELAHMTDKGLYTPPSLSDAVNRTADVFEVFCENNIPVIRIGLHATEGLSDSDGIYAGEYHSAMGELVESRYYYKKIRNLLDTYPQNTLINKDITVLCAIGETSKIIGHKRENKIKLQNEYNVKNLKVLEKSNILVYNIEMVLH